LRGGVSLLRQLRGSSASADLILLVSRVAGSLRVNAHNRYPSNQFNRSESILHRIF